MADAHDCAKRNSHNRTFEEINKVSSWSLSNMRRSVSSDIQTLTSDISNTRRSVSCNISNTRRSVLSDIPTLRSGISNTRRRVFHLMLKHRKVGKNTLVFRVELRTSWRSMFLKLLSYEGQKCLVVRRFKIPFKGWAEASLAKFCAPIWCAEVTCRSSVLQVDTCSATLQKIISFLRKQLLYFRWYRLGRRLQFII